jgi:hypothetical protein
VATKEKAVEVAAGSVMEATVMELIFEMSMKIEKVKAVLTGWIHRRRWLKKRNEAKSKKSHIAELDEKRLHKLERFIKYHAEPQKLEDAA